METNRWLIRIRSKNHLDSWMQDYLGGELQISNETDGTSLLTGFLPDLPAVYGLILMCRDTGFSLISLMAEQETVCRKSTDIGDNDV